MVVARKHHELYEELGSIVGAKYVSDDLPVLLPYTRDTSTFPPEKPQGVVVRPGSTEEVVELVKLANQTLTPLIPIGGKVTLSGGPPGQPGRGILVDMRRMDKVIEIDEANMAVTAQCGITNAKLTSKVNERGWDIPTADTPFYPGTVGGQMSGFAAGGFSGYAYCIGFNWHYILGLKVVLPDGSVVDTGTGQGGVNTHLGHTFARGMHGPDFTGMFLGDGGIFGIKVETTRRMFRLPKFKKTGVRCWDNVDEAYQALYELWEIDSYLYMQPYAKCVLFCPELISAVAPMGEPAWTIVWMCIGNSEEEIELKVKNIEAVLDKHGGIVPAPETSVPLIDLMSNQTRNIGRFATMGLMVPFELIVSRKDMLEAHKWSREFVINTIKKRGIDSTRYLTLGVIVPTGTGCGITSYPLMIKQNDKELHRVVHEVLVEFFEQARRRGYIIEEASGHESRLRAKSWTPEFNNYVLGLKKYLDPNNIMNPGVYFL